MKTCRKSLAKLLALLELGPGTSYSGHSWPVTKIASTSRMENSFLKKKWC